MINVLRMYNKFKRDYVTLLQARAPRGYMVTVSPKTVTNDVELTAINLTNSEIDTPILLCHYIEDLFVAYCDGDSLEELIALVINEQTNVNVPEDYRTLEYIKNNVFLQLINKEHNKALLKNSLHRDVEGTEFAAIYRVLINQNTSGVFSYVLNEQIAKELNIKNNITFYRKALKNTEKFNPAKICKLSARALAGDDTFPDEIKEKIIAEDPYYLISNESSACGAIALFYNKMLKQLYNNLCESFYLLPASTNEWLIIAESETESPELLTKLLRDANDSTIKPEEFLSNNVYRYDVEKDTIVRLII